MNIVNNEGYPPIVYGVYNAVIMQKMAVTREKDMIRSFIPSNYNHYFEQKWEELDSHYHINLKFCFELWVK